MMFGRFFIKSDIEQGNCNNQKRSYNHKSSSEIKIQSFIHIDSLSNFTAIIMHTIAKITSYVNVKIRINEFIGQKFGVKTIKAIHPAAKFVKSPDKTRNQEEFDSFFFLIKISVT